MNLRWTVAVIASLASSVFAVFADEAYTTDFHHALLGLPQPSTTFFHAPYAGSKAVLLYTLSEKNVLAALNPRDGAIIWRQLLPGSGQQPGVLRRVEGADTVITASEDAVRAWTATDGKLAWEYAVQEPGSRVVDVEVPDMAGLAEAGTAKDSVALLATGHGVVVRRLDGSRGSVKWEYRVEGQEIPLRVAASATTIFVVTYHTTAQRGLKLKVTTLDPVEGTKTEEHHLSTENDVASVEDILFVGSNSGSHILAWTDAGRLTLKVNILGTSKISSFNVKANQAKVDHMRILASNRNHASPHFLVHYQTADANWAEVYHIDHKTSAITKAYDLPSLTGNGAFSVTTVDSNVFFTRITNDEMILLSSTSHGVLGKWELPNVRVPGVTENIYPIHASSEVVPRDGSSYAVRSAVLLSNGDWILIRNGEKDWSRSESLAGVVKAVWVPSRVQPELAQALEAETRTDIISAYVHRIVRHLHDFGSIPLLISSFPQFLIQKLPSFGAKSDLTAAQKAFFGFDKLVVAATENGRLVGIETGNRGNIVWNVKAAELQPGSKWTASAAEPVLAELLATGGPLLDGTTQSPDIAAWEKLLIEISQKAPSHQSPAPINAVAYSIKDGALFGHRGTTRLWQFSPPIGQTLTDISSPLAGEPIASIGKVLGDRTVLYKYLNSNSVLASAVNPARRELSVYLIDAVSGAVLYSTTHLNVDASRQITSALTENWFAYAYATDTEADSSSKGYQLVITELLESVIPNDRGILTSMLNSSTILPESLASLPVALSQTYHVPEEITAMGVTQTLQGITSRELLVALGGSNSIVAIPRFALDPRRVVGKDPSRSQMEEGLSRYAPMLDFDPKWYLNHKQEVIGVRKIVAAPALLESTSLVFAYGLDVFGTRVAPSFAFDVLGDNFNKVQLLLTVVALTIGAFCVAPFIARKQTNMLWTSP